MSAPILTLKDSAGKEFAFSLGKMPARTSFHVRIRLIKMVGEPLFRLFAGGQVAGLVKAKAAPEVDPDVPPTPGAPKADGLDLRGAFDLVMSDADTLGSVVRTLSSLVNPDELLNIADTVFASCRCNGKPMAGDMFDATFAPLHPGAVEQVLFAALKENYANFFGAAA